MRENSMLQIGYSTSRQRKGFRFEKVMQQRLINAMIHFEGNDISSIHKWKRSQGKGVDITIGDIEVEVKYTHARVYPSYIKRDWFPRFSPGAKIKIVVANRGILFSKRTMDLIQKLGIIFLYYDQLINFLRNLIRPISKKNTRTINSVTSFLEFRFSKVIKMYDSIQSKRKEADLCRLPDRARPPKYLNLRFIRRIATPQAFFLDPRSFSHPTMGS